VIYSSIHRERENDGGAHIGGRGGIQRRRGGGNIQWSERDWRTTTSYCRRTKLRQLVMTNSNKLTRKVRKTEYYKIINWRSQPKVMSGNELVG